MNKVLTAQRLLTFVWMLNAEYSMADAVSVLLRKGAVSTMLVPKYSDVLLTAVRAVDPEITAVETSEQWYRVKVHGVSLARYTAIGLGVARQEIEMGGEFQLKQEPRWLMGPGARKARGYRGSTIVVTVGSQAEALKMVANGLRFGGVRHI